MLRRLTEEFSFSRHLVLPGLIFLAGAVAGVLATGYLDLPWSPTVASVNGERIAAAQWHAVMESMSGDDALHELIQYALISQEARRQGIQVDGGEVDAQIAAVRDSLSSPARFAEELAAVGMTEELFWQRLYHQLLLDRVVRAEITADEKRNYFERYSQFYQESDRVDLRQISLESSAAAQAVKAQLQVGTSFDQLSLIHTIDEATLDRAGLESRYGPEAALLLLDVDEGEIVGPLEGTDGFHIVEVTGRHEAAPVTFPDVEAEIEDEIVRQKTALLLERLLRDAEIEIRRP